MITILFCRKTFPKSVCFLLGQGFTLFKKKKVVNCREAQVSTLHSSTELCSVKFHNINVVQFPCVIIWSCSYINTGCEAQFINICEVL